MIEADWNWTNKQERFSKQIDQKNKKKLADQWNVSTGILTRLGIGWSSTFEAYTFPEYDGAGNIIGINTRNAATGEKRTLKGSKRGIYYSQNWDEYNGPILIPEGVSDTAVLLENGICAIGRPSCSGGINQLAIILRDVEHPVYILAENDEKPDGKWPGKQGARKVAQELAKRLNREIRWSLPPDRFKDVREFFAKGGADD